MMDESNENNNNSQSNEPNLKAVPDQQSAEQQEERDVQKEFDTIQKELLYLRAEFENSKKRLIKEQEQAIKYANEKLIRDLLKVFDLFELGMAHGKSLAARNSSDQEFSNFLNGINLTQRELEQVMTRHGVEMIGQVGEPFDPNRHEAISQLDGTDYSEDTVAQVFQKGCLLHGRLLSPARVAVGKPKE